MRYFILTLIFGLGGVIGVNVWVDPGHRWHRTEGNFESNWPAGHVWVTAPHFEERSFRARHIGVIERPEVLVLGSSRAMVIRAPSFATRTFYNASISGASMEDIVALWQGMKETGKTPKELIFVADTWLLNRNTYARHRWLPNFSWLNRFYSKQAATDAGARRLWAVSFQQFLSGKFLELIDFASVALLKQSLLSFYSGDSADPHINSAVPMNERPPNLESWASDGSLVRAETELSNRNAAEVRLAARNVRRGSVQAYMSNWEFDADALESMRLVLKDAHAEGTKVTIIIPPFHPDTYRILSTRPEFRTIQPFVKASIEALRRDGETDFSLCDVTDPSTVGCTDAEFFDSSHMDDECAKKVLAACLKS